MNRLIVACVLAVSLSFATWASGHGDENHGKGKDRTAHEHTTDFGRPGNPQDVTRTVEVRMSDSMRFQPETIPVKRGETIRFLVRNTGNLDHELVLGTMHHLKTHAEMMRKSPDMAHDDPNMVRVAPGKTGELIWRFTRDGDVDFACLVPGHLEAGMVGKIHVGRGGK